MTNYAIVWLPKTALSVHTSKNSIVIELITTISQSLEVLMVVIWTHVMNLKHPFRFQTLLTT
jgi:hypothetical protein